MKTLPLEKSTQIALFVCSIVFGLINPPVVALRFVARRRAGLGGRFGWSDAAIVAALVSRRLTTWRTRRWLWPKRRERIPS